MTIILKNVKIAINITATATVASLALVTAGIYYAGWVA
jgi:hypothetical protein